MTNVFLISWFTTFYHVNGEFGREAINCIIEGKRFPKHLKEI